MPFREYEAKVFVKHEDLLLKKFEDAGATLLQRVLQKDSYFDLNYRLTKKDELLRIRIEENIETHQFLSGEFSWKSGRKGEQYEVRKDISIPLLSEAVVGSVEAIITRLGFRKLAWLIKYRDRWRLNDIEFEFDKNIEAQAINRARINIGSYLQATIETNLNLQATIEHLLWDALRNLGFESTDLKKQSYIELYLIKLNELTKR